MSTEKRCTGGCILLGNGRGLKNQGGFREILEKEVVFRISGLFHSPNSKSIFNQKMRF